MYSIATEVKVCKKKTLPVSKKPHNFILEFSQIFNRTNTKIYSKSSTAMEKPKQNKKSYIITSLIYFVILIFIIVFFIKLDYT